MTTTTTARDTVDAYFEALLSGGDFSRFLTDDVVFELVGTGQRVEGRAAVRDFIDYAHHGAFDSTIDIVANSVDADGRRGAVELVFHGPHIGEFAGLAPTGREVSVPYSVHYDLTDHGISAIRVYALAQALVAALTG